MLPKLWSASHVHHHWWKPHLLPRWHRQTDCLLGARQNYHQHWFIMTWCTILRFDIKNFYLVTPIERPDYVCIEISNIPQIFIDKYNLTQQNCNGWVYFEKFHGCYFLPQAGKLANYLLCKSLNKASYYEAATTPRLWHHKWLPILVVLIIHDFGIECLGDCHTYHM